MFLNISSIIVTVFVVSNFFFNLVYGDICFWCDKRTENDFTNCLRIKILSNPIFSVGHYVLEDMGSGPLAASSGMNNMPYRLKMKVLTNALAGEVTGMILSQTESSKIVLTALTDEILRITGDCYSAATGGVGSDFWNDFRKSVLKMENGNEKMEDQYQQVPDYELDGVNEQKDFINFESVQSQYETTQVPHRTLNQSRNSNPTDGHGISLKSSINGNGEIHNGNSPLQIPVEQNQSRKSNSKTPLFQTESLNMYKNDVPSFIAGAEYSYASPRSYKQSSVSNNNNVNSRREDRNSHTESSNYDFNFQNKHGQPYTIMNVHTRQFHGKDHLYPYFKNYSNPGITKADLYVKSVRNNHQINPFMKGNYSMPINSSEKNSSLTSITESQTATIPEIPEKQVRKKREAEEPKVKKAMLTGRECAEKFTKIFMDELIQDEDFRSTYENTPYSKAKVIASKAIEDTFNSFGLSEFGDEAKTLWIFSSKSLAEKPSVEKYAEDISKSIMTILYRNGLLAANCETLGKSFASAVSNSAAKSVKDSDSNNSGETDPQQDGDKNATPDHLSQNNGSSDTTVIPNDKIQPVKSSNETDGSGDSDSNDKVDSDDIQILILAAKDGVSPAGYNYDHFMSAMDLVLQNIKKEHPNLNSQERLMKLSSETVTALGQALQEIKYNK